MYRFISSLSDALRETKPTSKSQLWYINYLKNCQIISLFVNFGQFLGFSDDNNYI